MSYHRLTAKPLNATLNVILKRAAHVGIGVGAFAPVLALANPTGGQVVAGQANISAPNANSLVIKQASQSAIINWQQFSIGSGQYVQFAQPSSSSVVLNRVVGGNATSILGNLSANGQVFLVNPNGIFFGKGATLDVQGIVASTLDISNSDFLAGNYVFDKGSAPDGASVVNQGNIHTRNGGYVVLAGDYSENDGLIQAQSGHVVLAAGAKTTLTLSGNRFVNFAVDGATLSQLAGAKNAGSLLADGGTVIMTADVANQLKATVVNNTGLIEARSISKGNGAIYLTAEGGNIVNAGTLNADAGRANQAGGSIQLKGDAVTNLTATSKISALGMNADGGHLEVSGKTVNVRGTANLGRGGNLLLDPGTMSIGTGTSHNTGTGHIGVGFIEGQLNSGANVTISASHAINRTGSNVNAITATGTKAAGATLALKAGTGTINLGGVNITIGGALTASFGYGTFGFIQAKSVAFTETRSGHSGSVGLHKASTSSHGKVTKNSIKATSGDVTITGDMGVYGNSGGTIAINAKGNVNLGSARFGESDTHNTFTLSDNVNLTGKTVTDTGLIKINGGVKVAASGGNVVLGDIFAYGGSVNLAATGGNLSAHFVDDGNSSINITDTTGNVTVATLDGGKNVTVNAKGHKLSFASGGYGYANSNLNLTAATIAQSGGSLHLTANTGNLNIKGKISLPSNHSVGSAHLQTPHNLDLTAGNTVTLNTAVTVPGALTVTAPHLAFTGGKSFSMSAADGNLTLDASIGSVNAPAAYNVNLKGKGDAIRIQKSVYTGDTAGGLAANITATETGYGSFAALPGVFVGASYGAPVTVLAKKGNVALKGWNVGVGQEGSISYAGPITVQAGGGVIFSASGEGSKGGHVAVQAGKNIVGHDSFIDTSVLVKAGGGIRMVGNQVDIRGGTASVHMGSTQGYGSASANVSLVAGRNVFLIGASQVDVMGGSAKAGVSDEAAGNGHSIQESAHADVSITANGSITLSGNQITVSGGQHVVAHASAAEGLNSNHMTATATADAALTAGGNISLTGGTGSTGFADVHAGGSGNGNVTVYARAGNATAKANATAHGDVDFSAHGGISLTATRVNVDVGYGVGKTSQNNSSMTTAVAAGGSNASANGIATANIDFTAAGTTGITLSTLTGKASHQNINVRAGGGIANNASISATGSPGVEASLTAGGHVHFTATAGTLTLSGKNHVAVSGGTSATRQDKVSANQGTADLSADGSVDLTAANILISNSAGTGASLEIVGGTNTAERVTADAKNGGIVSVTGMGQVNLAATGNVILAAAGEANLRGARYLASRDTVTGSSGGSAAIQAYGGIGIAAGGTLKISSKIGSVRVFGGSSAAGSNAHVSANDGKAALNADDSIDFSGKAVRISALQGDVSIEAGYGVAHLAHVNASNGGSASLDATAAVNVSAGAGGIGVTAKTGIRVAGGSAAHGSSNGTASTSSSNRRISFRDSDNFTSEHIVKFNHPLTSVAASGSGAVGKLTGAAGVSLTTTHGGGITLNQTSATGGDVSITGGSRTGRSAGAFANNGGSASLKGDTHVNLSAGVITITGHQVEVTGGQEIGGRGSVNTSHSKFGKSFGSSFSSRSSGSGRATLWRPTSAQGANAKADFSADGSVTISGTTVALTATGADVEIRGGYAAAQNQNVLANSGGSAKATGKAGVNITATTAFTALAHGNESIGAGVQGGSGAAAHADGSGAMASVTADASVSISGGGTIALTATSGDVLLNGGRAAGRAAQVQASSGGSAAVNADASLSLQATAVSLNAAKASIDVSGGYGVAALGHVGASDGGLAHLSGNGNVSITAGVGGISLTAKRFINLGGGTAARGDSSATHTTSANVRKTFNSSGSFSSEHIVTQLYDQATATANGNGAVAGLTGTATLSLTTTNGGAIVVNQTSAALGQVSIHGGFGAAMSADAVASGGGSASLTGDTGVSLSGGAINIKGHGVTVAAGVKAGARAHQSYTTAHSFFGKSSGSSFSGRSSGTGSHGFPQPVAAKGPGAQASLNADASVAISGTTVSITARGGSSQGNLQVLTGRQAAYQLPVQASGGGIAKAAVDAKVALTATGALNLTAAKGYLFLGNFGSSGPNQGQTAYGGAAMAHSDGQASLTADSALSLQGAAVTLTAGTFTRNSSHHALSGGYIVADNGFQAADNAQAFATSGGSAQFTVNDKVSITATAGALTVTAASGLTMGLNFNCCNPTGKDAGVGAFGAGAKAALDIDTSTTLSGTAGVTLTGATGVTLTAASGTARASVAAGSNGHATFKLDNGLSVTTAGAFKASAAKGEVLLYGGSGANSRSGDAVHAAGAGATAGLTSDGSINVKAASVTLIGGRSAIVAGGSGIGGGAFAGASYGGVATFAADHSVNITAVSGFTMALLPATSSGGELVIAGGSGLGYNAAVETLTGGGTATVNVNAGVNVSVTNGGISIKAGQHKNVSLRITAGSGLGDQLGASSGTGSHHRVPGVTLADTRGDSASELINGNVNLTATGAVVMNAGATGNLLVGGGGDDGVAAEVEAASGGKATRTIQGVTNIKGASVSLAAGKNVTVTAASAVGQSSSRSYSAQVGARSGGAATLNLKAGTQITATGAFTATAGSNLFLGANGASSAAMLGESAGVTAYGGHTQAAWNGTDMLQITAGTVSLTALRGNISIGGASDVGKNARAMAHSGGVAALNLQAGVQINAKGAFTAAAAQSVRIDDGGFSSEAGLGESAKAQATNGRAQATFSGTDNIQITAGSVSLTATQGSISISGGISAGRSASASAQTRGDKATFNATAGVGITATGTVGFTAAKEVFVGGGAGVALHARAQAGTTGSTTISGSYNLPTAALATTALTVNDAVNLKAGGVFTAVGSSVKLSGGNGVAASMNAFADGNGDTAKATATSGISISAAGITLVATKNVEVRAGSLAGIGAGASARDGAFASLNAANGVTLNATGNVALVANTGNVEIDGGNGSFIFNVAHATAGSTHQMGSPAQAAMQLQSAIAVNAGGNLNINAKRGSVSISGGNGVVGDVEASSGSATLALDASVTLSAGKFATFNAGGGSLQIRGGGAAGLVADLFTSRGTHSLAHPGTAQGKLNTGVSVTAGSNVTLSAHGDVVVAAGAGETVAVGKIRKFSASGSTTFGNSWAGGSANLSADVGAGVTAGKLLTVNAGTGTGGSGNIVVQGLGRNPGQSSGFYNIVSVRGGSSHGFASVNLNGDAELAAGSVMLNAARVSTATGPTHKGNLSIDGGSLYNVRADHTKGDVTLTGSADAGITAMGNVTFNAIGGSVNVMGAGNSSSAQFRLVDAHGNSGSANVTGHADATITAGHDIVTVNALGGGLNVLGGQRLAVVAIGSAGGALQQASGSAKAGLTAGDVISISGAGDLNVLGGAVGQASAAVSSATAGRRAATLDLTTTLSGTNGVTLRFGGDGVIAAGDSVAATSKIFGAVAAANATADASTTVSGKNIVITTGGNLLVRAGGSDEVGGASASIVGVQNSANFTTRANLNLTATGNIGIAVGTAIHVGTASFVAGNVPKAQLKVYGGKYGSGSHAFSSGSNRVTGNLNADLNVMAGGNIGINIVNAKGKLNVSGGQAVGASAYVLAGQPYSFGSVKKFTGDNGVATANISSKTTFKSGGNTTITLHGGTVNLTGGFQAASNAVVDAAVTSDGGTAAKSTLTLNESLSMTAGGALTITGAAKTSTGVVISTQVPSTSSFGPFLFPLGSHATANVTGNSTVTLSGKTLSINGGHFSTQSAGTHGYSSPAGGTTGSGAKYGPNSVFLDGRINLLQNGLPLMSVAPPLSVSVHTLDITRQTLEVAPQHTSTSFGMPVSLSSLPSASPLNGTAPQASVTGNTVTQAADGALGTLQSTGLVVNLVSVVSGGTASASSQATAFDPALSLVPAATGSGAACTTFVPQSSGSYRCGSR